MADDARDEVGDLVIAVYLDVNVLLDLLATVEDGFTLVERVTSGETSNEASERSGSAEFRAPSILNLFKLGFTGKLGKTRNRGGSESSEAERTHTYGSLLHRLRGYLVDEGLVVTLDDDTDTSRLRVGSFIEFNGVARPNPFTASFDRLLRMLSFVDVAMAMEAPQQPAQQSPKGGRSQNQPKRQQNAQVAQLNAMREFFQKLTTDVEREGTSTIVFEGTSTGYTAVATIFDDFLRDRSMAELLNREFRVLGKVARHLPAGSNRGSRPARVERHRWVSLGDPRRDDRRYRRDVGVWRADRQPGHND
ncbi:MAG: hypothetical protein JJE52_01430 [Acidimicrobiia bacterium]|nr:hypothetical protein [Acidimicrobiia bacterium]